MTALILYATHEGQTGKIARFVETELRKSGVETRLADALDTTTDIDFAGVDTVILAAPVHERRHPKLFEAFLTAQQEALERRRTLMLSVSLSAAFPEGLEEAEEYLIEMKMRCRFDPDAEALVAGAVRTSKYDYFASQLVRHVVLRDRDYDPAQGEYEFTDWAALRKTLSEFLATTPASQDA